MKKITHTIWFPSHGGNMGIISKIFKQNLTSELHGLSYSLIEARYETPEIFKIELEVEQEEQITYIQNKLNSKLGLHTPVKRKEIGDTIIGRVLDPNQVGFGIFCSSFIGDVLIPLYELRKLVDASTISSRKISEAFGFVENIPLELEIEKFEKGKTLMNFTENQMGTFQSWIEEGVERVITSMTYSTDVKAIVKQLDLDKYISEVYDLDPLTTVIVCNPNTRGSGLLPIIGSKLHSVPIGIFRPMKIKELISQN